MGIEADKEAIGSNVWIDRCKFAQDRANKDEHVTSDIGVLWAEDKISALEAKVERLTSRGIESMMFDIEVKGDRIATLESEREWISVDTPPEDEGDCLVYDFGARCIGTWCEGHWNDPLTVDPMEPTHWLPLPAAPTGEG